MTKCSLFISVIIFLYLLGNIECQVCTRKVEKTVNVQKSIIRSYTVTYKKQRCWFRCVRTMLKTYIYYTNVPENRVQFVSECCSGYIEVDRSSTGNVTCRAICSPACNNGKCISPGKCECNRGYVLDTKSSYNCLPTCAECLHGTCVKPNTCKCDFGYELRGGKCQPVCSEPCTNGTCTAPETCKCYSGFRELENNICKPYCSKGCSHGVCVSPEVCSCHSGWNLTTASTCEPICSKPCGNGTCIEPNTCACNNGYKIDLDVTSEKVCTPHCSKGCRNGQCISPEICSCPSGYNLTNASTCEPICSKPCGNGTCSKPNTCMCNKGYKIDLDVTSEKVCTPHCSKGCRNGQCIRPEICNCPSGWNLTTASTCEPICDKPCGNGTCIEPNKCACNNGYKIDLTSTSEKACAPHCSKGCNNGRCISPEVCICPSGWNLINPSTCKLNTSNIDVVISTKAKLTSNVFNTTISTFNTNSIDNNKTYSTSTEKTNILTDTKSVRDKFTNTAYITKSSKISMIQLLTIASVVGCCSIFIIMVLICKRKALYKYCKRNNYVLEDDNATNATTEVSEQFDFNEIKFSSILRKKEKEEQTEKANN